MSVLLDEHLGYVSDAARLEQFKLAVARAVQPGSVVADLGCGSGILGLLCLQAGAAHVYFIDDGPMLDIARQTLTRAGFADRATFLHGRSQQIELTQRCDIVICDHVGCLGFDYGVVGLLDDAKRRFLNPGGRMLPVAVTLELAAVESEACRKRAEGWRAATVPQEFHWLGNLAVNSVHHVSLKRAELLGGAAVLGRIDFLADHVEMFSWTAQLEIAREGVLHGLGGWFQCELAEGIGMSNSPLSEKPVDRSQVFLPLGAALPVQAGDRLKATLLARPDDNLIAWSVEVLATGKRFSHSTWQGMLLSAEDLLRADPERVPRINDAARARDIVLGYCDGRRTVRDIEHAVLREHPGLFPSSGEISRFVAQVLRRDTG